MCLHVYVLLQFFWLVPTNIDILYRLNYCCFITIIIEVEY